MENVSDMIFQSVVVLPAMLAVIAAYAAILSLTKGWWGKVSKVEPVPAIAPTTPAPAPDVDVTSAVPTRPMPAVYDRPDWNPAAMVVKDLNKGKATLILRGRPTLNAVTVQLIIWAGVSRKKKRKKFEDSMYDLGFLASESGEISHDVIAKAIAEGRKKLADLAQPKQRQVDQTEVAVAPAQASVAASDVVMDKAAAPQAPAKVAEEASTEVAVKMKKSPVVFRGRIVSSGFMPRPLQDKVIENFGLKYRTVDGIEDVVWGVDLRRAMDAVDAKPGDLVEILKVGRKTMEKGKAPMNLYQIAKISAEQLAAVR